MNVIVTGGANGLGAAIVKRLRLDHNVISYDLPRYDVRFPTAPNELMKGEKIGILVNCAGFNTLDWLENLREEDWEAIMDVNAKGIYKMSQFFLRDLTQTHGTILNIISDAAHRPMRASLAYNASKAAAWIMTLQLARELTLKNGITVFGIAPAHIADTKMSRQIGEEVRRVRGWSPEENDRMMKNGMVTGEFVQTDVLADFIGYLLNRKERHLMLSGCVLPYGAGQ